MTQFRAPRHIEPIEDNGSSESESDRLSEEERAFLTEIYLRPFVSVTRRYKSIDLGG